MPYFVCDRIVNKSYAIVKIFYTIIHTQNCILLTNSKMVFWHGIGILMGMKVEELKYVVRSMRRATWPNIVKTVSVAFGMVMSALLFSAVAYNRSFDRCFRDSDRLYTVCTTLYHDNGQTEGLTESSVGRLAEGILAEMADDVESATTTGFYMSGFPLRRGSDEFRANRFAADSLFFDTMGIDVLEGNPREDLKGMDVIYLSDEMARWMFGDENPIGRIVTEGAWDLTVRGVFKALPDNTTRPVDAVISLPTLLARYNGGNLPFDWDRPYTYYTFFKTKSVDIPLDRLQSRMEALFHSHSNGDPSWRVEPDVRLLRDSYFSIPEVRRNSVVMAVLAGALLFVTVMNYILITLASLGRRAKAVGVYKCNGASGADIFGMFMTETAVIVLAALLLAVGMVFYARTIIVQTLAIDVASLFALERIWIIAAVVGLIFITGGMVPARVFTHVHVTTVFRRFTDHRSRWKRTLLAVEFASVAFIFGLMCVVMKQYDALTHTDLGYDPGMIAVGPNPAMGDDGCRAALAFFRSLPYVEAVSSADNNPVMGYPTAMFCDASGHEMFSYGVNCGMDGFAGMIGMDIIAGHAPERAGEVAVSESFARRAWPSEQPVGMTYDSYGEWLTVTGVYADIVLVGLYSEPVPTALEWTGSCGSNIYVKLKEPLTRNLQQLNDDAHAAYPTGCPTDSFRSLSDMNRQRYAPVRAFRNMAVMAWITIMVITLMGLVGYVADEIQRRSKEIAVRKINGADSVDIINLLCGAVLRPALPSVLAGGIVAWYVGQLWLRTFFLQTDFTGMLIAMELVLLAVIVMIVVVLAWRVANDSPVRRLRYE